ncbi:MAG: hypothetical protein K0S47_1440 [Herbinix sp.]|jgi:putative membrane protein|nr:hypothetical protein [Herbinix sp.]
MWMKSKKIISLIVVGVLISLHFTKPMVQAAVIPSEKEEVVYVNLDGNGNRKGTYVVNIFSDKEITDYGNYNQVKNMNTIDKINYNEGLITILNSSEKLYYEGVLERTELPWNINITYQMDGVEYTAADIAGKSGELTIKIAVTENLKAKKGFFDHYALQTVVKLASDTCKDLVAEGSTQANVGNVKQLTYTIMPGKEKDIVISAKVTDFEMESIQMNGIRLDLGIDRAFIDTEQFDGKINDIERAVSDLDDGAEKLLGGASGLNQGAVSLKDGITTVYNALTTLSSKSAKLTSGSKEIKDALTTIHSSLQQVSISVEELNQLSSATKKMREGVNNLVGGLEAMNGSIETYYSKIAKTGLTDMDTYLENHNDAIAALNITDTQRLLYTAFLTEGDSGFQSKLGELVKINNREAMVLYQQIREGNTQAATDYITLAGKLISIENLLKADFTYIRGSNQLIEGIYHSLDKDNGMLMTGAYELQNRYATFQAGIENMISSLGNLATNMENLKNGINALQTNYETFHYGLGEYTDALEMLVEGYDQIYDGAIKMVSGTSDLYTGTKDMSIGTDEFVNETLKIRDDIDQEIDEILKEYTNSDYQVVSFVSDKNTNVQSVQFVIKVAEIQKDEIETSIKNVEGHLSFWQKFLRLFGLY